MQPDRVSLTRVRKLTSLSGDCETSIIKDQYGPGLGSVDVEGSPVACRRVGSKVGESGWLFGE